MINEIYEQLADALDKFPNGFPRTASNVEIPILQKNFSQNEALLASRLSGNMESADMIAQWVGLSAEEARTRLIEMVTRGLLWTNKQDEKLQFRLAPFAVEIYEAQLDNMDYEFAHLVEKYMAEGGAIGIMKPQPAIHHVVPTQRAVKSEYVTGCPEDVPKLQRKLDAEIVTSSVDFATWEQDRLRNRRLIE